MELLVVLYNSHKTTSSITSGSGAGVGSELKWLLLAALRTVQSAII